MLTFIRNYLSLLLFCIALVSCNVKKKIENSELKQPNIVFIIVDDLGWSDTSFMGNPVYENPNLDNLAASSVVFSNAYAPAGNCAPSRACIISGKYPTEHGIYTVASSERGKSKDRKLIPTPNIETLADDYITIAEALKTKGYVSASMGK
jgi:arylsulfatase A-like enzyme|tara:strand:+ start:202 stop:651 length:450 start_codon:yes stop_codon:yes gene_type:complete